jgi:hypothetical protein
MRQTPWRSGIESACGEFLGRKIESYVRLGYGYYFVEYGLVYLHT